MSLFVSPGLTHSLISMLKDIGFDKQRLRTQDTQAPNGLEAKINQHSNRIQKNNSNQKQ
jgi:hypothetical protein